MDCSVVVCGCGGGELFGYWLSVLNDCGGVSWMRFGGWCSRFAFSWGEPKFISSSFFLFFYFCLSF